MTAPADRRRGVAVPIHEVSMHLWNGWTVIDDLARPDDPEVKRLTGEGEVVMMAPPDCFEDVA